MCNVHRTEEEKIDNSLTGAKKPSEIRIIFVDKQQEQG